MADLERLIIDNFKINSGGKTPGTKLQESSAMNFSQRATPHRLRFDGGTVALRSIENRLGCEPVCTHTAKDGLAGRVPDGFQDEDKENAFPAEAPALRHAASGRLEFMDSADLTLLESPITSRQFSEITEGKTPSKFAVARLHLRSPSTAAGHASFLHMDCSNDEPGPSKVPQLSALTEYDDLETLHDLEAALEQTDEESACSRYEIISTDSPEMGRTCGLVQDMDTQFVFGAPLAQVETTKNFNVLTRVPSNTQANRMLNFDKENSSPARNSCGSASLSFTNRIRTLRDNTSTSSQHGTGSSSRKESWSRSPGTSQSQVPRISRCLNFGLEKSHSQDSGYSPRNSESSRGSPVRPYRRLTSETKLLHSDSMESGCASELSEDFHVFDQDSQNAFKNSQETTMDILFSLGESPRLPSGMQSLISGAILSTGSPLAQDGGAEMAVDAWSPNPNARLTQDAGVEEQQLTPVHSQAARPAVRRYFSMDNPDVQRIRTKLFDSPNEKRPRDPQLPSPFKVPFSGLNRANRPFKRVEPSALDGSSAGVPSAQLAKRARHAGARDILRALSPGAGSRKPSRPVLQRSLSDNADNIKRALARSVSETDLIGDFSLPFALPVLQGQQSDLTAISAETLAHLIQGQYKDTVQHYQVVDCRYPYEYAGGHISGSLNLYRHEQLQRGLLTAERSPAEVADKARRILVFHCEFSMQRGPNLFRFVRRQDREMHKDLYPLLQHPEMYLLSGGYRAFHSAYPHLCTGGYTRMLSPSHAHTMRAHRSNSHSHVRKLL